LRCGERRKAWDIALLLLRSWSAAPVNAFTLWKPQNVRVTKGAEFLGKFAKTEMSHRQYCKRLRRPPHDRPSAARPGRRLCRDHSERLKFSPGVHVNYAETVLPMKDGLPKLKDFPPNWEAVVLRWLNSSVVWTLIALITSGLGVFASCSDRSADVTADGRGIRIIKSD